MQENNPQSTPIEPEQVMGPLPYDSYDDTELLTRIDKLEKNQKHLNKIIDFVQNTNSVVLLVMALGFIALLVTVIGGVVQSWNERRSVQTELIKSIENLKLEINQKTTMPSVIYTLPTPTQSPPSQRESSAL